MRVLNKYYFNYYNIGYDIQMDKQTERGIRGDGYGRLFAQV